MLKQYHLLHPSYLLSLEQCHSLTPQPLDKLSWTRADRIELGCVVFWNDFFDFFTSYVRYMCSLVILRMYVYFVKGGQIVNITTKLLVDSLSMNDCHPHPYIVEFFYSLAFFCYKTAKVSFRWLRVAKLTDRSQNCDHRVKHLWNVFCKCGFHHISIKFSFHWGKHEFPLLSEVCYLLF